MLVDRLTAKHCVATPRSTEHTFAMGHAVIANEHHRAQKSNQEQGSAFFQGTVACLSPPRGGDQGWDSAVDSVSQGSNLVA